MVWRAFQIWGDTGNGLVCVVSEQEVSGVLFPSPGSSFSTGRRVVIPWDNLEAYTFPLFSLIRIVNQSNNIPISEKETDCPMLAKSSVVP